MKDIKRVSAMAIAILVVIFVLQNTEPAGVEFLPWTWSTSRAPAPLIVLLVGVAVGW